MVKSLISLPVFLLPWHNELRVASLSLAQPKDYEHTVYRLPTTCLPMTSRILVVDDDKQIVRLLQSYLQQEGFSVLTAFDGDEALHKLRSERPDCVLLDLMLPGKDGWEITRIVRGDSTLASTPILMLTARVEDEDKIEGIEIGADDYVTKPFNPREVVVRVKALLRRSQGAMQPPRILQIANLRLDLDTLMITVDGAPLDLTPTELALLQSLMQNPNHPFTRGELVEKALGYEYEGMERTIDSHIKNLRKKLDAASVRDLQIETVFGIGYRLKTE